MQVWDSVRERRQRRGVLSGLEPELSRTHMRFAIMVFLQDCQNYQLEIYGEKLKNNARENYVSLDGCA